MDVDKILAERGGRYGSFYTQGLITQDLKANDPQVCKRGRY
jgi:hypothetical protein